MPIRQHLLSPSPFNPPIVEAMSQAFVDACSTLGVPEEDLKGREAVAFYIIELASNGLTDVEALRDHAIREFMNKLA